MIYLIILASVPWELSPVFFAGVLASIGFALWIYNQWKQAKGESKTHIPQPLTVRKTEEFVTKKEVEVLRGELQRDYEDIRDGLRNVSSKVHTRIDTLIKTTAEQEGTLKQISKTVDRLLDIATNKK